MGPIDPAEFVASVQPMLAAQDPDALMKMLKSRWNCEQIPQLLTSDNCDARKVAALALALVGTCCCVKELACQLRNPDPTVNQMAEHALWSIWFRAGTPEANHELCRGMRALNRGDYDFACKHFTRAAEIDPTFSEAYNQRAIVAYLREEYDQSLADCERTVERMPCHFGAWSGMGHCHAHQGRLDEAIRCYQRALEINPHLSGIAQAIEELEGKVNR